MASATLTSTLDDGTWIVRVTLDDGRTCDQNIEPCPDGQTPEQYLQSYADDYQANYAAEEDGE